MRWRQVALALATALAAGWAVQRMANIPVEVAVAVGILIYVVVRVALATLGRTRHYVRSGASPGRGRTTCGNCGSRIWRLSGDWILTCKRYGWQPGLPGVRWLTRSVPVRQLWRSIEWQRVALLGVAGLVVMMGSTGGASGGIEAVTADNHSTQNPETATAVDTDTTSGISTATVERQIFEKVNKSG